jgi:hypothetical protein
MPQPITISVPQTSETPVQCVAHARYCYRYAYARSADSRVAGDAGQDYLAIRVDEQRFAFALCDGVSQSFMGDLAARLLGDWLLEWLWQSTLPTPDQPALQSVLDMQLQEIAKQLASQVRDFMLPADLPPLLQEVLEQKRALGSESTFVSGLIDISAGQAILAWMGDSRLRLWGPRDEPIPDLGDTFHTRERWSSRQGPVGRPHVAVLALDTVQRLVAYSDGLALLDDKPELLGDQDLDALIAVAGNLPTSDDMSFLEVRLELSERPPMREHPSAVRAETSIRAIDTPASADAEQTLVALLEAQPMPTVGVPIAAPDRAISAATPDILALGMERVAHALTRPSVRLLILLIVLAALSCFLWGLLVFLGNILYMPGVPR